MAVSDHPTTSDRAGVGGGVDARRRPRTGCQAAHPTGGGNCTDAAFCVHIGKEWPAVSLPLSQALHATCVMTLLPNFPAQGSSGLSTLPCLGPRAHPGGLQSPRRLRTALTGESSLANSSPSEEESSSPKPGLDCGGIADT